MINIGMKKKQAVADNEKQKQAVAVSAGSEAGRLLLSTIYTCTNTDTIMN